MLTAHEKSGQNVFKANKEKRVQPISHALPVSFFILGPVFGSRLGKDLDGE